MKHPMEEELWGQYRYILGMDEAGRGPLCGPAVVAGVIFEPGYVNEAINDSKKLSEKKREALFAQIVQDAKAYWIVLVSEQTIDTLNIYRACQQAMEQIAEKSQADFVLSDAMPLRNCDHHEAVIKGDTKSISIAAASILAKVTRDHYMIGLDEAYPWYGLKSHKGYPTKKHLEAIEQYGVTDFYRKSFGPVARILEKQERLTLF